MKRTLALLAFAAPVLAQNDRWPAPAGVTDLSDPATWPGDPGYAGDWNYWSFVGGPARANVSAQERAMGSGFHADRAWQRTTGDPRVVIAVLDSGIEWRTDDLVTKYYLNRGELPPPSDACHTPDFDAADAYDSDGDGVFTMLDWAVVSDPDRRVRVPTASCDRRVTDANGNGFIDPEDLIRAFSDGTDDDGNGYVDDISGWDFFHGDNDPADDVEFGHGTGEAHDSSAAGNNGRGSLGVCPLCRVLMVRVADSFVAESNDFALGAAFAVDSGASVIQEALGAITNSTLTMQALEYAHESGVTVIASAADEDSVHQNFPGGNEHTVYVHAIVYDSLDWEHATTYLNFNNCTNYGPQLVLSTPGTGCSSEATGRTSGIAGLIYSAALQGGLDFPGGMGGPTDAFGARRLTADEVKQLLITTVDDIDVAGSADDPTRYPSRPGWEQRFGYGRPNARSAVDAVLTRRIPPEVELLEPTWLKVLYPERTPSVELRGRVGFRADLFDSVDYVVEWAPGIEPPEDPSDPAWTVLATETITAPRDGVLATWDISHLTVDNPDMPEPDRHMNRRMVTLRVRATAHSAALGDVSGVTRKAVHVDHDPDLLPAFPVWIGASDEGGLKIADVDGDGRGEIVLCDADGHVHAIRGDGTELAGWPASINRLPSLGGAAGFADVSHAHAFASGALDAQAHGGMIASPAVADLDGDGRVEVVAASYDGFLFAFEPDASVRAGFPVEVDRTLSAATDPDHKLDAGFFASPVLADLDNDGKLEIAVPAMDGRLYAWRADGTAQAGFPVTLQLEGGKLGRSVSSPAVGDVDGDGVVDLAMGTNEDPDQVFGPLYIVHGQGTAHPGGPFVTGWPQRIASFRVLPLIGEGLPNSASMADVDGDGKAELVIAGIAGQPTLYRSPESNLNDLVYMNKRQFGAHAESDDSPAVVMLTGGAFGDLDGDGHLDYVQPTGGFNIASAFAAGGSRINFQHQVSAWHAEGPNAGKMLDAWPRRAEEWQFFMTPAIADIDGDGRPEVLSSSAGYFTHAWNADGVEPAGWPKLTGQMVTSPVAIGDIDGDCRLDVVVPTRGGWLFAWRTPARADTAIVQWNGARHDNRNTGNAMTPLPAATCAAPPDGGTPDAFVDHEACPDGTSGCDHSKSCGCHVGAAPAPGAAPLAVAAIALVVALRSRPRRRTST